MNIYQPGLPTIEFMSAADTEGQDNLLTVRYKRCQPESPVFLSEFDGIDQSVDVKISTFIFRAAPEPVLAVYDFIMTTFVPGPAPDQQVGPVVDGEALIYQGEDAPLVVAEQQQATQKIKVLVNLASVQGNSPTCVLFVSLTLEYSHFNERRFKTQYLIAVCRECQRPVGQQHDAGDWSPRKPQPH